MSLESIINKITNTAGLESEKIIQEARSQAEESIRQAKAEAQRLSCQILDREKSLSQAAKQKLIVNARIESRKNLLKAKQELIDQLFKKIKSEIPKGKIKEYQVLQNKTEEVSEDIDFYLDSLRHENETEVAGILFS